MIPKLWKINEQKLQLNSTGTPEEIDLTPCDDSWAGKEEERLLSFPGNNSANEKNELSVYYNPPNFLFLSFLAIRGMGSRGLGGGGVWPCFVCGSPWWLQIPKCNSLLILQQIHFCWRNSWQCVCFRSVKHALMGIGSDAKYSEIARAAGQQSILSWPCACDFSHSELASHFYPLN